MELVKVTRLLDFKGVLCRDNINLSNAIKRWIFFSEVHGFKSSDRITSIFFFVTDGKGIRASERT